MIKQLLTLTNAGLLVIVAGLVVAALTFGLSNRNDRFLEEGIARQGRVISLHKAGTHTDSEDKDSVRVRANLANSDNETLISIVEVKVPPETFEETEVGSQIPLLLLPGDPPSVRLKTKTEEATFGTGYLLALSLGILGLVLIWLDRHEFKPRPARPKKPGRLPRGPVLPDSLQKIAIKSTVLYDGPFEFSYAEEKTRIDLSDGTSLRINQYRPLADLSLTVPESDLLEILKTAKSNWDLPADADGQTTLKRLVRELQITEADQFFINRDHLGILSREEVENGRWYSWVRGVWRLSASGRMLAGLLSANPAFVRKTADEILYHEDVSLVSSLAPHLAVIRKSPSGTPDDKRALALTTELIEGLHHGKCSCQIYTAHTGFSPELLLAKKKMKKKTSGGKDDTAHDLACTLCDRTYSVTAKVRAGQPQFQWEEIVEDPES